MLLLGVSGSVAVCQLAPPQEPKWLDLRLTRIELGARVEGDYDTTSFSGGRSSVTYSRLFAGPEVGLDMAGSIFHPNFCRLSFVSEGAYGYSWQHVTSSEGGSSRGESLFLGNYRFYAGFLDPKPYRGSVFLDQNHTYRDNDFYSRVLTDSLSYGGEALYDGDFLQANAGYTRRHEDSSSSGVQSTTISDNVNFGLAQPRAQGKTSFLYTFSRYDYASAGFQQSVTENNTLSLSDVEKFGGRDQFLLNSRVGYSRNDYSRRALDFGEANEQYTAGVDLGAEHSGTLRSDYSVFADHYESATLDTTSVNGSGGVTHQLYESLSSSLTVFGNNSDYSDINADGYMTRIGVTWGENYTKRLTEDHTLRLYNGLTLSTTEQQGISTVENEAHTFGGPGSPFPDAFWLNQLNVVRSSIRVYDATKTQLYIEGIAYNIIVNGAQTLIERRPGVGIGGIPEGATVLVDYQSAPTQAGSYDTIVENFRIRVDLWGRLWGVYVGYGFSDSTAGEELGVLNFTRFTAGTDFNWKALSAGAEVERYDSDQSEYESLGLFQSASLRFDDGSALGMNLSERWIRYLDAGQEENQYRFNAHYNNQLLDRLRLDVQAGATYRTGRFDDEVLAAVRPSLNYRYGRTTMTLDYAFEYSLTGNSTTRLENMVRFIVTRRL